MAESFGNLRCRGEKEGWLVRVRYPYCVHGSVFFDQCKLDIPGFRVRRQSKAGDFVKRQKLFDLFSGAEESAVKEFSFFKIQYRCFRQYYADEQDTRIQYSEQKNRRIECPCNERQKQYCPEYPEPYLVFLREISVAVLHDFKRDTYCNIGR